MSTTLITSRHRKGRQAVRVFEAVYDKARLDDERAQRLNEHPEYAPRLKQLIDELCASKPATQFPPVEEWFDLTVDNTADPMSVVTSAGYDATNWEFRGPPFPGKKTRRVKLVGLGYVANLQAAREAAKQKGYRLLEGQAREALKAKYPSHNGRPIVFGGNEWRDPDDVDRLVACLGSLGSGGWGSLFDWSGGDFGDDWLWAVVEQDA